MAETQPRALPRIIAVTGPTASGKTGLAIDLAEIFHAEIINADSVQVYRGADIGSAKPGPEELRGIPHHLLSTLSPEEDFDAASFRREAGRIARDLINRGNLPIVCGGTGLYLRALLGGMVETPAIAPDARRMLDELRLKNANIYEALKSRDPYTAESLNPADVARVQRAFLVHASSGQSLRKLREAHGHKETDFSALVVCLLPLREDLYSAVDIRVEQMMKSGLLEEVKQLRSAHPANAKLFSAIGYRHATALLEGSISREKMVDDLKRDTRRFAKRQYTWWRHQPQVLGWKRLELPGASESPSVKRGSGKIIESLSLLIRSFLERKEPFTADSVYFVTLENIFSA